MQQLDRDAEETANLRCKEKMPQMAKVAIKEDTREWGFLRRANIHIGDPGLAYRT